MAKTKQQKVEISEKVNKTLKDSESVVFVNFHGLGVTETTEMRRTLAGQNVNYFVAKKTLIRRALNDAKIDGDIPELNGEVALASAKDSVAPAREIYSFAKKYKDNISILGGIFENRFMNKEEMTVIASIPSLLVLYGQFVNVINSPIQGLVVALDQIAQKKEV